MSAIISPYQFAAVGGGGGTDLLDLYPNAAFAFSFRRLRSAWGTDPVAQLRRDSDDTFQDFGTDINGDFDVAGVVTWASGANLFVRALYDQSGAGNMAYVSNGTTSQQPYYSSTGFNGLPCLYGIEGETRFLANGFPPNLTQGTILTAISHHTSGNSVNPTIYAAGWLDMFTLNNGNLFLDFGGGGGTGRVSTTPNPGWYDATHILEGFRDASDNQGLTVDGINLITSSGKTDDPTAGGGMYLGYDGNNLVGRMAEMVLWSTDLG